MQAQLAQPAEQEAEGPFERCSLTSGYVYRVLQNPSYWDFILGQSESRDQQAVVRSRLDRSITHEKLIKPHRRTPLEGIELHFGERFPPVTDLTAYGDNWLSRACILDYIVDRSSGVIVPSHMHPPRDYANQIWTPPQFGLTTQRGKLIWASRLNPLQPATLDNYQPPLMLPYFFITSEGGRGLTYSQGQNPSRCLRNARTTALMCRDYVRLIHIFVDWPGYDIYDHAVYVRLPGGSEPNLSWVARETWRAVQGFFNQRVHEQCRNPQWRITRGRNGISIEEIKVIGIIQVWEQDWQPIMEISKDRSVRQGLLIR